MSRPTRITPRDIELRLQARGPLAAAELAALLRVNRATVVRGLAKLGDSVVSVGATRRTRYALRREVRNCGQAWPIYRIEPSGGARAWCQLEALHGAWRVAWPGTPPGWAARFADREGLWRGFPFFLADLRPQGFIGRALARRLAASHGLPEDPRRWSDDDTLVFLLAMGEDLPGDLVTGDVTLRRALANAAHAGDAIDPSEAATVYPQRILALASGITPSSAGGEQPKFLADLTTSAGRVSAVLVKFSPPMDQALGRHWADLLAAEWHAQRLLAEIGLASPGARLIDGGKRRFLEVPRFDRTPTGGRRGVITLEALCAAGLGELPADWPSAAAALQQQGFISEAARQSIIRLHAFGELIGNNDMHFGNLSLWLDDAAIFRVAPAYDMLPMLWAPGPQGELGEPQFRPAPPLPARRAAWLEAAGWARQFWQRLAVEPQLTAHFQSLASAAAATVEHLLANAPNNG